MAGSLSKTMSKMHEKLKRKLIERSLIVPTPRNLTMEDVRNRQSWFWIGSAVHKEQDKIEAYFNYKRCEEEIQLLDHEMHYLEANCHALFDRILKLSPPCQEMSEMTWFYLKSQYIHRLASLIGIDCSQYN